MAGEDNWRSILQNLTEEVGELCNQCGVEPARLMPGESQLMSTPQQTQQRSEDRLVQALQDLATGNGVPRMERAPVPEKCEVGCSTLKFRAWRRSVEECLATRTVANPVQWIRLLCTSELQQILDSQFSVAEWRLLTVAEALEAVEDAATVRESPCARWQKFFSAEQRENEAAVTYFRRVQHEAAGGDFSCPGCSNDLTSYMLVRRVLAGVSERTLKRELYLHHEDYLEKGRLLQKLRAYDSAEKKAGWCAAAILDDEEVAEMDPDVCAVRPSETRQRKVSYGQMGRMEQPKGGRTMRPCHRCDLGHGNAACPARNKRCRRCGQVGHFAIKCVKRMVGSGNEVMTGAVLVSGAVLGTVTEKPPTMPVHVRASGGRACKITAVVDTGAQVTCAGPELLRVLGIPVGNLSAIRGVKAVDNTPIKCLGRCKVRLQAFGKDIEEEVYIMNSADRMFVSFGACKRLGVIPDNFPSPVPQVASVPDSVEAEIPIEPVRPSMIPYAPLEENVTRLENWLKKHFSGSVFNTTRTPLPVMTGPPHRIHLLPGAHPVACHTPARVAKHWEDEVKRQLDEDVRRGIIMPVAAGEAVEWCARMVVVSKRNGQPRRTVDYQGLNKWCRRETHYTKTPFDMVSSIPKHSFKTVVDAYWGFHQVELAEESSRLTTFITPWGRYRYLRTPMGHCAAPDAYTKRFDDAIQGIERKVKCIDDILLYDNSIEDSFWHIYELLDTCAKRGITLQPNKFRFCRRETEFVGYHLGWEEYKPTEERLASIKKFPMPEHPSLKDIRAWHGMVNQLAPFMLTTPVMQPFTELLKSPKGKQVYWDVHLQKLFEESKNTICRLVKDGLAYYDKTRPTAAVTDWSKEGIGFAVFQQQCKCVSADTPFCCKGGWRLALCGSRKLTDAEKGYVPIEGEALAVAWCLKKARLFLLGCPNLVLVTDHKPLVSLFGDRSLNDIDNPRLFRMKEKTLHYRFTVKYVPGKINCAVDTLSRYPALTAPAECLDEDDLDVGAVMVAAILGEDIIALDDDSVREAAVQDQSYQRLLSRVRADDWPRSKAEEMSCLRPFYQVRDRLSVSEDLVTYSFDKGHIRLVVPECLRSIVASHLHAGHQGVESMLRRARQTVYWPGMEADLKYHRTLCSSCEEHAPSQPAEPLVMTPPPNYPFEKVAMDFFQLNSHTYLVYADRLSGWLEIGHFPSGTTSSAVIVRLLSIFKRWGVPKEISSDGGKNLDSDEMRMFYRQWGITVRVSSAHYPQSNGRAEAAVKSAKRLLRGNVGPGGQLHTSKVTQAMLQYLNSPLRDGDKSPAQLAAGRQLRDGVPAPRQQYLVSSHWRRDLRERERMMASHQANVMDGPRGSGRTLPRLALGVSVRLQNPVSGTWDRTGRVTEAMDNRMYMVVVDGSGRITRRNRRHLRPMESSRETDENINADVGLPVSQPEEPRQRRRASRERRRPAYLDDYV